jgi:hypothetical protein
MAALAFRLPVTATLSSVILYVTGHMAGVIISHNAFYQGILFKMLFLAMLWRAFQSARTAWAACGNAKGAMSGFPGQGL